jgi:radical SAM/Cys-rich protein
MMGSAQEVVASYPPFIEKVDDGYRMTENRVDTLQINIGLRCNLACRHCHVQAGPHRNELMDRETMRACLGVIDAHKMAVLDVTGGAPEMNPHLPWLLEEATKRAVKVMVRSNLTILTQPGFEQYPEIYAHSGVTLIASLPHYIQKNTDHQRGEGTFDASIRMLQKLNDLGYGKDDKTELNLVFNPGGAFLPPSQAQIEREYKTRLFDRYHIVFNSLFAIANNPLGRFADTLYAKGSLNAYMDKLLGAFNAATVPNMMCRSQLSVDYQGICYDCDFNQAAGLPCLDDRTVFDYRTAGSRLKREVHFGNHCYACCAGSGSSCGGATA